MTRAVRAAALAVSAASAVAFAACTPAVSGETTPPARLTRGARAGVVNAGAAVFDVALPAARAHDKLIAVAGELRALRHVGAARGRSSPWYRAIGTVDAQTGALLRDPPYRGRTPSDPAFTLRACDGRAFVAAGTDVYAIDAGSHRVRPLGRTQCAPARTMVASDSGVTLLCGTHLITFADRAAAAGGNAADRQVGTFRFAQR